MHHPHGVARPAGVVADAVNPHILAEWKTQAAHNGYAALLGDIVQGLLNGKYGNHAVVAEVVLSPDRKLLRGALLPALECLKQLGRKLIFISPEDLLLFTVVHRYPHARIVQQKAGGAFAHLAVKTAYNIGSLHFQGGQQGALGFGQCLILCIHRLSYDFDFGNDPFNPFSEGVSFFTEYTGS